VEIKDAVAVITGGASGLGLATAKALLDEGAKVVILDLPSSKGEEVASQLKSELGDRAAFAPADVTDEEAVAKAFDLAETMGPVRIVVNCAGTGTGLTLSPGPFMRSHSGLCVDCCAGNRGHRGHAIRSWGTGRYACGKIFPGFSRTSGSNAYLSECCADMS